MDKQKTDTHTEDFAERKRRERLEQNRVSAMESRKRKKTMIEELQVSVIQLSKENKTLSERNDTLRRDLIDLGTKHPNIVPLHSLMSIGFQAQNLNPGRFPMTNTPAPANLPPATTSSTNGTPNTTPETMLQINNALAAYMLHQQLAAQMMNNASANTKVENVVTPAIPTTDETEVNSTAKKDHDITTKAV